MANEAKPATSENKKRSRTLYMSDDDWDRLSNLADKNKRGRTAQIMHMVETAEVNGE